MFALRFPLQLSHGPLDSLFLRKTELGLHKVLSGAGHASSWCRTRILRMLTQTIFFGRMEPTGPASLPACRHGQHRWPAIGLAGLLRRYQLANGEHVL